MKAGPDFKAIAARALDNIEAICAHWLPAGKKAGPEWEIGDRHGAAGKSLKVHLTGTKAGQWADFAAGDKGGDLVSLVAYVDTCSQGDAARKLADFLGLSTGQDEARPTGKAKPAPKAAPAEAKAKPPAADWRPILPIPDDAPPHPAAHPKQGKPDRLYTYRGQAGEVLGYVARWEAGPTRPKKEFGWLVFAEAGGRREWRWQGFPVPRPLYGLDALADRPAAAVLLVEGEKACEAAWELLPDHAALTWPGGGKAADKADFTPLKGRDVILWADADEPGRAAMKTAARLVRQAGAASVRWLSLPALAAARNLGELPQGFDAADLVAEGWDVARMVDFLARPDALLEAKAAPAADAGPPDPGSDPGPDAGRFTPAPDGLYMHKQNRDGGFRLVRLSDPLNVPALARDEEGGGWAPVLEFRDRDGRQRQEIIPFRLFLGDGSDGVKQLADCGLAIEPGREAIDGLKQYIASARPEKRARLVDATGWHGGAFLFPDGALGDAAETLIYQGSKRALGVFSPRGKLADWQAQIAALAVGNWRLMFTLSAAFAGPLLKPCGAPSCAFHWTGDSSLGKSGALAAAGSVWGHPLGTVHSWRSTDNSLEYVAAQHNDGLLILDELKEVDPRQAGAIAYMLGNSKGKNRAHHAGGLREAVSWRIAMLSSGEIGLADHLASAGQKTHAGQAVRFIELPADAGAGLGMWNTFHHLADGRAFTDALKTAAAKVYGTAGRAFIAALIEHLGDVSATVAKLEKVFFDAHVPWDAGGQVRRVAGAFALVAAAGELAAEWGICAWPRRDAFDAAGLMFRDWLKARPTAGNLEEAQILAHVRQLMERNWQARFIDWHRVTEDNADLSRMAAVPDALGFRKDSARKDRGLEEDAPYKREGHEPNFLFYVTRGRFAEEFAGKGGFKPRRVAAVLRAHGILRCDEDGATWSEQLPNGDRRSYCIIGRKLWEVAADA
jgi:putative DNA primase/helicase